MRTRARLRNDCVRIDATASAQLTEMRWEVCVVVVELQIVILDGGGRGRGQGRIYQFQRLRLCALANKRASRVAQRGNRGSRAWKHWKERNREMNANQHGPDRDTRPGRCWAFEIV